MKIESAVFEDDGHIARAEPAYQTYVAPHAQGVGVGAIEFSSLPSHVIRRLSPKGPVIDPGRAASAVREFMESGEGASLQTTALAKVINKRLLDVCAEHLGVRIGAAEKLIAADALLYPAGSFIHADIRNEGDGEISAEGTFIGAARLALNSEQSNPVTVYNGSSNPEFSQCSHEGLVKVVNASDGFESLQRELREVVEEIFAHGKHPLNLDDVRHALNYGYVRGGGSRSDRLTQKIWSAASEYLHKTHRYPKSVIKEMRENGMTLWKRQYLQNLPRSNQLKNKHAYGALHPAGTPAHNIGHFRIEIKELDPAAPSHPELILWTPGLNINGEDVAPAFDMSTTDYRSLRPMSPSYRGGAKVSVTLDMQPKIMVNGFKEGTMPIPQYQEATA